MNKFKLNVNEAEMLLIKNAITQYNKNCQEDLDIDEISKQVINTYTKTIQAEMVLARVSEDN